QVLVHLLQQPLAGGAHRLTRWATAVARLQEGCELLRREAESNRIADEEKLRDGFCGVAPEAAGRPRRAWQNTDALVVPDEIRTDARPTSRLANSKGVAGHAPSYNLESFQIQDEFSP